MKEEEFFNDLKILVWNEFPYCRFNKRKGDYTLSYLKNFENLIIIDVEFIFLNIGRHLRYQIKENDIREKGKKLEKELSAKILDDIKKFQIDDID
jgi:hypothetical protein